MARAPSNATRWKERAEIDYLGPFVKAWAGFNAWFRDQSGSRKDADGLFFVKERANTVRGRIIPYLAAIDRDERGQPRPEAAEAIQFKLHVANLHAQLEAYALEVHQNDRLERISFRSICLKKGVQLPKARNYSRHDYCVDKQNRQWILTITSARTGNALLNLSFQDYGLHFLEGHDDYMRLSPTQRSQISGLFRDCDPRPMTDLVGGISAPIAIGDAQFRCTSNELFSGLVEIIYAMRNALLHGEIQPSPDVLELYEPAYRILMRFLDCVRD